MAPTSRRQAHAAAAAGELRSARRRRCRGRTASRGPPRPTTWVVAVAGLPARSGRVAAEVDEVVALVRRDVVELATAAQHVVAAAAEMEVAAVAAVDRRRIQHRRQRRAAQAGRRRPGRRAQRFTGPGASIWDEGPRSPSTHGRRRRRSRRRSRAPASPPGGLAEGAVQLCSVVNERSPTLTRPGPPGAARSRRSTGRARRNAAVGDDAARPAADVEVAGPRGRVGQRSLPPPPSTTTRSMARLGRVARSPVAVEVDGQRARGELEVDLLVGRAAGDEQPAVAQLERGRRRRLDELAVAAAGARRGSRSPPMGCGERAGELGVGEGGDQDQVLVERHGAAEQPLGRLLIGEQALAQRVRR